VTSSSVKLSLIRDHYINGVIDKQILPEVTKRAETNVALATVSDFFFHKATKTLDAICVLCGYGFAEDALILGRTIFELSLHLKTIALPDAIEQRQLRAESFIYDGDRQRVTKLKELETLKQQGKCLWLITQIEAQNPDHQTIPKPQNFVPVGNLRDMATALGDPWECWYHFLYSSLSKLVHPSGSGSYTYIQNVDQEQEVSRALRIAVTLHYYLTETMLALLDLERYRPSLEDCMKRVLADEIAELREATSSHKHTPTGLS
jgi:Family of unknown function (DUF5677)